METQTPEELVRLCQRLLPDDTRPFEQLVARYKDRVFSAAYRLMGDPHEAEDQAQEVFIKVFRNIKTLEEPGTVTSWIYRITTTTCLDAIAKRQRRPLTQPLTPPEHDRDEEPRYTDTRIATPEEAALQRELHECLQQTLAGLDGVARAILVLRDVDGRSYQEIADDLRLGLSAVKMRIHRARIAFKQLFDRLCPDLRHADPAGAPSH